MTMNGIRTALSTYETPFNDTGNHDPFPDVANFDRESSSQISLEIDSPFIRTYDTTNGSTHSPATGAYVNVLAELDDPEFAEVLYELVYEVEDTWRNRISDEVAMGVNYLPFARQHAREYFAPLIRAAELKMDEIQDHFSKHDFATHTENDIEQFFQTLTFDQERFTPVQEAFLGKVFNKVKTVVKKGVDLAKKGVSAVGKLLPINAVLEKLKGLVRPLVEKVLRTAIGKLPAGLRPHAENLAKKYLNLEAADVEITGHQHQVEGIQQEFDHYVARMMFTADEAEANEHLMDYEQSIETADLYENFDRGSTPALSYATARQRFIQELQQLPEGAEPGPIVEQFLPAAIMALQPFIKMGITLIGRQKIINFLADVLSKLVSKYVPAEVAKPLAANIIDMGMGMIGFEVKEGETTNIAYEAIANTIEDTLLHMESVSESDIDQPEMFTLYVLEAFEKAAAKNFPPQYIKENLRPSKTSGMWVDMPRDTSVPLYKKFTRVFDITLDPQMSSSVTVFRDLPLANFLRDKYGLDTTKAIRAKVHLYEIKLDGSLKAIQRSENLPALHNRQSKGWIQLLPLTSSAASVLLNEPGLGVSFDKHSLANRIRVKPGQRFYYLEINDAQLRAPVTEEFIGGIASGMISRIKSVTPNRSADIQVVLNFTKSLIQINYYFSEEDARQIVEKISKRDILGAVMTIRQSVKTVMNDMLLKNIQSKVKIIHEAMPALYLEAYDNPEEHFLPLKSLGKLAGKEIMSRLVSVLVEKVSNSAYQALAEYFKARGVEFRDAQLQPEDGVTVCVSWNKVPGMSAIRNIINAIKGNFSIGDITNLDVPSLTTPDINSIAGKKFV